MGSPNDPLRDNRRLERDDVGRGAGWLWIWIWVIIIIILVVWFGGWGWGGYGGWWWGNRGAIVQPLNGNGNGSGATGTNGVNGANGAAANVLPNGPGVAVLNATDKQTFIGKPFQVNNVPVQNKVNDQVLWVGGNNSTPILVVLTGAGNSAANANISQGNNVDITGTVQKAPPKNQAQHNWQLSGDDANRLEQEGAYIQATQVTQTVQQPQNGQQ
jgi:hypothetical protein